MPSMRSAKLGAKLLRDTTGSVIVEYSIVFPLFIIALLGTVDVTYLLYEWIAANKAAYIGVRTAVVKNPVATSVNNPVFTQTQLLGQSCYDPATGAANGNCPAMSSVCSGDSSACTNGFIWNETAFTAIFTPMQTMFPRLTRQNVQITYQTNKLGFYGQTSAYGGLPVNVTVSINCITHQFYFIDALMSWAFSPPAGCPANLQGPAIPNFASTLQGESLATN
jgi:Flp pilus assembly protein TadG